MIIYNVLYVIYIILPSMYKHKHRTVNFSCRCYYWVALKSSDKVVEFDHMWLQICSRTEVECKMISLVISNIVIIPCYFNMSTE